MDLLPKPDQVISATGNVAHKVLYGGLADLRKMPRVLIDDGQLREVYHYRPDPSVPETGDPVLLVTPLAAPASCFDLRRGCSLVEHLVAQGRPTYLVEYGQVSFRDRNLGMEHWISEVVPTAIREVARHSGGRPVHVVGWSLGGIFAALTLAGDADLPVASLTVVGSPFDLSKVPLIAPLRPLLNLDVLPPQLRAVTRVYQTMGGAPRPLVRWAFQLSAFQKLVTKPLALAANLDDADFLAQVEAVNAFTAGMIAYPGRSFGQLYHRMYRGNALLSGTFPLDTPDGPREIRVADITCPVLVFAGATDGIAPVSAVKPLTELLTGAEEVQFEVVPGGHLGMLTGRAARGTTWRSIDEWVDRWSTPRPGAAPPTPPRADRIGSNPSRRYGSAASRAFG
ncbi:alpha/beta fold hydrolase [Nocardioides sp. CPCC 205120]|uniref:alpha/beta fold hydrolase n=1 Tax=Nocardioides sp. CPCC 205120 TaxID=3406462 RepID=UPI003B50499D